MPARSLLRAAGRRLPQSLTGAAIFAALLILAPVAGADDSAPIARAFVYPVGNEFDFTKAGENDAAGYCVSGEYLSVRGGKKRHRRHEGVDISNRHGGGEVHAVASGVVLVSERNGMIKYRKRQTVRVPRIVDGKRVVKRVVKIRTATKWRTGWGNYVVIRHTLPSGKVIYSLYGHMAPRSILVKAGDVVLAGQTIGKVGRTGRATSPHLHLEIRESVRGAGDDENLASSDSDDSGDSEGADETEEAIEPPSPQARTFALLATMNPMPFLREHVMRFDDLTAETWQARYANAAVLDGVIGGQKSQFDPDDAVTRADYYRALVTAFRLGTPFTKDKFSSSVDALVDSGVLDGDAARNQHADDNIDRSDALELLLRCLDKGAVSLHALSAIKSDALTLDFNRQFAGQEAALKAIVDAKAKANADYRERTKAAQAERARLAKAAKAKGRKPHKVPPVKMAPAIPQMDVGFEALARSAGRLTRAESCLLLATASKLTPDKLSALQRASTRTATSG